MSRQHDYRGPIDIMTGHPVGCECWTCYLGRCVVPAPTRGVRAPGEPPTPEPWVGPDSKGGSGL
jgi:hypothetical protein